MGAIPGMPPFSVPVVMKGLVRKQITVEVVRYADSIPVAELLPQIQYSDARTPRGAGSHANSVVGGR